MNTNSIIFKVIIVLTSTKNTLEVVITNRMCQIQTEGIN